MHRFSPHRLSAHRLLRAFLFGLIAAALAGSCGRPPTQHVEAEPAPARQAPDGAGAVGVEDLGPLPDAQASDEWQRATGFEGDRWGPTTPDGELSVMVDSVGVSETGTWTARGLVRNEGTRPVGGAIVSATLVDATGQEIERVDGPSPVTGIRPGEPVPFELVGTAETVQVSEIRWSAAPDPALISAGDALASSRQLRLATYWTREVTASRTVDFYLHSDESGEPRPHLLFGSVTNLGPPVAAPEVVGAWLDETGRVQAIATAPLATPTGEPATSIDTDGALDVLLSVQDPAVAIRIVDSVPMLWGFGR